LIIAVRCAVDKISELISPPSLTPGGNLELSDSTGVAPNSVSTDSVGVVVERGSFDSPVKRSTFTTAYPAEEMIRTVRNIIICFRISTSYIIRSSRSVKRVT
jgi:hypothetical protein